MIRPSAGPQSPPRTYADMWESNPFKTTSSREESEPMDHILTQPPPRGHHLFSRNHDPSLGHSQLSDITSRLPTFGQFDTSDDFTMGMSVTTPLQKRKDRSSGVPTDTPSPNQQPTKRGRPSLDTREKLHKFFDLLHELDWTLGEFLYHVFAHKDEDNNTIHRSSRHGIICQHFLSGNTSLRNIGSLTDITRWSWVYGPAHVRHLDSISVHQASSTLEAESDDAVKPAGGLHSSITVQSSTSVDKKQVTHREWTDLGAAIPTAARTLQKIQPVAFYFLGRIAEPKPRSRNGVVHIRKSRPRENVVTHCLSILDFCKNDRARLEPLARGILYLSSRVPVDIIANNSRIGTMPAVNTIKNTLKGFSDQKAIVIRARGRDTTVMKGADGRLTTQAKAIIFDNVQHFQRQRDLRIGRENTMIIGIAGTFFSFTVDVAALDVLDKRHRILHSRRPSITVHDLLQLIDQPHLKRIGILQFLESLSNYIPEASIYKKEIYIRYRTRVSKLQVPPGKTPISPLATSGKNEASISELKDGLLDFLELGQTEADYDSQLFFGGGDGMSYNNMLLLKKYLQNHKDPFQSFELLRPVLQLWHTFSTDLCRICETHWGDPLNDNPATLGHSAKKRLDALLRQISRSIHFRTNDIFEYFSNLARNDKLPSFEELEEAAKKLFETYVSSASRYQVQMDARDGITSPTTQAPLGAPWQAPVSSSPPIKSKRKTKKVSDSKTPKKNFKKKKATTKPAAGPFTGDQLYFDEATFMHDAMISREAAAAAAQGAVGRVWEALKVMLFTFAGSAHSKYMGYLLEMVVDLEFESNPFLRDANLMSMVLNPDGREGNCKPCDIFQEFLNRCIDPVVQRKDTDYGSYHVRTIWSRNIKDIYDLKADFRASVGLAKRSGRHKEPHERPEVKILLREYQKAELHKRPGRTFSDGRNVDNFQAGINLLEGGVLRRWAHRTTNSRIRKVESMVSTSTDLQDQDDSEHEGSEHESDWCDDSEDDEPAPMSLGDMRYTDGRLVIDVEGEEDDMTAVLEEHRAEESGNDDQDSE
ncbi:hypothetical protein B0H11DRAFT_2185164 [Mycena galericulata]|nr:hypothetical protein B0H11DRAFT_2185164 [Mycena galericulata]